MVRDDDDERDDACHMIHDSECSMSALIHVSHSRRDIRVHCSIVIMHTIVILTPHSSPARSTHSSATSHCSLHSHLLSSSTSQHDSIIFIIILTRCAPRRSHASYTSSYTRTSSSLRIPERTTQHHTRRVRRQSHHIVIIIVIMIPSPYSSS